MSTKIKSGIYGLSVVLLTVLNQCKQVKETKSTSREMQEMTLEETDFGTTPDGEKVTQYILRNSNGMTVKILNYGGIITSWTAPDRNGNFKDVVLGFNTLDSYISGHPFFGAIIGRYGNRIGGGSFELDGTTYELVKNNGQNHLHGGLKGFDKAIWEAVTTQNSEQVALTLSYRSPDGEEGYPGNLDTRVRYTLHADDRLTVDYQAITDKPTVVNLTQHSYFNLSGDFSRAVTDHTVTINADRFLPVDDSLIPTGEFRTLAGSPLDFREAHKIGDRISQPDEQLIKGGGYDHCWILNKADSSALVQAATAYHSESGRLLEVYTTEPGLQFYTGNFLDNSLPAKGGGTYGPRSGFCFETEHFPDSPNKDHFPTTRLNPGEIYSSTTVFRFSVR